MAIDRSVMPPDLSLLDQLKACASDEQLQTFLSTVHSWPYEQSELQSLIQTVSSLSLSDRTMTTFARDVFHWRVPTGRDDTLDHCCLLYGFGIGLSHSALLDYRKPYHLLWLFVQCGALDNFFESTDHVIELIATSNSGQLSNVAVRFLNSSLDFLNKLTDHILVGAAHSDPTSPDGVYFDTKKYFDNIFKKSFSLFVKLWNNNIVTLFSPNLVDILLASTERLLYDQTVLSAAQQSSSEFDCLADAIANELMSVVRKYPSKIYKCVELWKRIAAQNTEKARRVIVTLVLQLIQTANELVSVAKNTQNVPDLANIWANHFLTTKLATGIHFVAIVCVHMPVICMTELSRTSLMTCLLSLLEQLVDLLTTLAPISTSTTLPQWLCPLLSLIDQFEKYSLLTKRRHQVLSAYSVRQWKWWHNYEWNCFDLSTNQTIDNAYRKGKLACQCVLDGQVWIVHFGSMTCSMDNGDDDSSWKPVTFAQSDTLPTPSDQQNESNLAVIESCIEHRYPWIIESMVVLLGQSRIDAHTLQSVVRLCLRMSRTSHKLACQFASSAGITKLLNMATDQSFDGLVPMTLSLIRHVYEDAQVLRTAMENNIVRSVLADSSWPPGNREQHLLHRTLHPAACRDTAVFVDCAKSLLQIDHEPDNDNEWTYLGLNCNANQKSVDHHSKPVVDQCEQAQSLTINLLDLIPQRFECESVDKSSTKKFAFDTNSLLYIVAELTRAGVANVDLILKHKYAAGYTADITSPCTAFEFALDHLLSNWANYSMVSTLFKFLIVASDLNDSLKRKSQKLPFSDLFVQIGASLNRVGSSKCDRESHIKAISSLLNGVLMFVSPCSSCPPICHLAAEKIGKVHYAHLVNDLACSFLSLDDVLLKTDKFIPVYSSSIFTILITLQWMMRVLTYEHSSNARGQRSERPVQERYDRDVALNSKEYYQTCPLVHPFLLGNSSIYPCKSTSPYYRTCAPLVNHKTDYRTFVTGMWTHPPEIACPSLNNAVVIMHGFDGTKSTTDCKQQQPPPPQLAACVVSCSLCRWFQECCLVDGLSMFEVSALAQKELSAHWQQRKQVGLKTIQERCIEMNKIQCKTSPGAIAQAQPIRTVKQNYKKQQVRPKNAERTWKTVHKEPARKETLKENLGERAIKDNRVQKVNMIKEQLIEEQMKVQNEQHELQLIDDMLDMFTEHPTGGQRHQQQQQRNVQPVPNGTNNQQQAETIAFIESLGPELRQQVLLEMDEREVRQLPAELANEVRNLRRAAAQRVQEQLDQEHERRRQAIEEDNQRQARERQIRENLNKFLRLNEVYENMSREEDEDKENKLVDQSGLCSLLSLVFMSKKDLSNVYLSVLTTLAATHQPTSHLMLRWLLDIVEHIKRSKQHCSLNKCTHHHTLTSANMSPHCLTFMSTTRAKHSLEYCPTGHSIMIRPQAFDSVCRNALKILVQLESFLQELLFSHSSTVHLVRGTPNYFDVLFSIGAQSTQQGPSTSPSVDMSHSQSCHCGPVDYENRLLFLLAHPVIKQHANLSEKVFTLAMSLCSENVPLPYNGQLERALCAGEKTDDGNPFELIVDKLFGDTETTRHVADILLKRICQTYPNSAPFAYRMIRTRTVQVVEQVCQRLASVIQEFTQVVNQAGINTIQPTTGTSVNIPELNETILVNGPATTTATQPELHLSSLSALVNGSSIKQMRFVLEILLKEFNCSDDENDNNPLLQKLDLLWDKLTECLGTMTKSGHLSTALKLKPLIETFFKLNAPHPFQHSSLYSDSMQQQLAHTLQSVDQLETVNSTEDESKRNKFVAFITANRVVLNQILRADRSLDGPFAVLLDFGQVLDFDVKRELLRFEVEHHLIADPRTQVHLRVKRNDVFEDSYRQLHESQPQSQWKRRFVVSFVDEIAEDTGGPLREWYRLLAKQIFNTNYALFTTAADQITFVMNSSSHINDNHLKYFRFVGKLIAKAIYDEQLIECYFTRSLYKHILGKPVHYTDMEMQDPDYYKGLVFLLKHNVSEFGSDLRFSYEMDDFGTARMVDLIPNGHSVFVTEDNKRDYVRHMCHLKMTKSICDQLRSFLEGFYTLLPKRLIAMFNERELELLISGLPTIDLDDIRRNTIYQGYHNQSPQIDWLWRALDSFSHTDRAKFLQFVTGTSKVPLSGFSTLTNCNFIIRREASQDRLPSANTCIRQLNLPMYQSYEKLHQMVLKAVQEGSEGFGFV